MSVKLQTEHHLEFLCLKGGSTGSSESRLVKMPHRWKSRVKAHLYDMSMCKEIIGPRHKKNCLRVNEEQRCSPACESTQSDQCLCY